MDLRFRLSQGLFVKQYHSCITISACLQTAEGKTIRALIWKASPHTDTRMCAHLQDLRCSDEQK